MKGTLEADAAIPGSTEELKFKCSVKCGFMAISPSIIIILCVVRSRVPLRYNTVPGYRALYFLKYICN